jgi:branched-chain amino acid transport system permease protein
MGRNIRAVAESPTFATLLGIDVKRVNQQTFFIASALAGAGGLMFSLRNGIASSDIGFTFGLKALAIMAIGGMGDLRGAVLGGILLTSPASQAGLYLGTLIGINLLSSGIASAAAGFTLRRSLG